MSGKIEGQEVQEGVVARSNAASFMIAEADAKEAAEKVATAGQPVQPLVGIEKFRETG